MESVSALQPILLGGLVVAHLLTAKDQALLDWRDAFLLLDALLYARHLDGTLTPLIYGVHE